MSLVNLYKRIDKFFVNDLEEKQLISFIKRMDLTSDMCILDVGCGYGRNMRLLQGQTAAKIEGVDINPKIIEANIKDGLFCRTVDEFKVNMDQNTAPCYDCMIFSHIIEHFMPEQLKQFLDYYLHFLKTGGYVIITTPLLWEGFYWDFDHIKVYHPIGIGMVFGDDTAQVQYYDKTRLKLLDIWFRRDAHRVHFRRGLYVKDWTTRWWSLFDLFYKMLFKISLGRIGITNGWMGFYQKM